MQIHSFVDVAPMLAGAGFRVIIPYLPQEAPQTFAQAVVDIAGS